jgi:hypothetical protein
MGQVISIPSSALDYMMFGDNRSKVSNYIQQQINELRTYAPRFFEGIKDVVYNTYNYLTNEFLFTKTLQHLQDNNINIHNQEIFEYLSYEAVRDANITMQRYIMAYPQLRELYLNNKIDGYSETYVNMFNDDIGDSHYDYRKVMDGVIVSTENGFKFTHYNDELLPGDKPLSFVDRMTILRVWDEIDFLLNGTNYDFTNKTDGVKRG